MAALALAGCGLRPPKGQSDLILDAARDGDVEELARLIGRAKRLVDVKGEGGRTALHLAAAAGHEEIVKLLLDKDADPNRCDRDGVTPLHAAAKGGHAKVVRMLLKGGADVYVNDTREPADPMADAASEEIAALLREKVLVVEIYPPDVVTVDGERVSSESLGILLKERAGRWPDSEGNLSTAEVRILGHPDSEYPAIQRVMVACMRVYIWKLSFGALKEEVEADGTQ
jgi:hypothetical protein